MKTTQLTWTPQNVPSYFLSLLNKQETTLMRMKKKFVTHIDYDLLGNPVRIQFTDRSYTENVFAADGRKLKTSHITAVPSNTHLALGEMVLLSPSHILSVDSTEYLGNFLFDNGLFKQYHFDGGYFTTTGSEASYKYYVRDHLGSNRILASYNGTIQQETQYYPYGGIHHFSTDQGTQKFKYNGKELDLMHGLNLYDYGARLYDPLVGQFTSIDPLCEKYYSVSPYAYCAGNPVNRVDLDGREVRPAGNAELLMIQNTLPLEARQYVVLNADGLIDKQVLNSYNGSSLNFDNLKTLVNSSYIVDVRLDDHFEFADPNGITGNQIMSYFAYDPRYDEIDTNGETINGLSSGESGFLGKTLFPDREGLQNSVNKNIQVIVNKNLSPAGAAEVYSHEGNGHALLYVLNGGNHKGASHQPVDEQWIEGNIKLKKMIIDSKKETIHNMKVK